MKIFFLIIYLFLIVSNNVQAQDIYYKEDSAKINAKIESDFCEWGSSKTKLLKSVVFKNDSTETYYVDKKTNQLLFVRILRSPLKRSSEAINYFYLHDKIFWIFYKDRKQGKMLIMKDSKSGIYYFSENSLMYKEEYTEVKRTEDFLITNSNIYFSKYLQYLNESKQK